uniref:Carbohydrate sulfotransferase n=1 Tax=Oryzias latipes TaxID=8090 RepID=A0A3B3I6J5_ORYLA
VLAESGFPPLLPSLCVGCRGLLIFRPPFISVFAALRYTKKQGFRKDLLRKYCKGGNQSLDDLKDSNLTNVIVDDKHGIIYCYIPKVACTNWKRTLIALNYSEPYPDPMSFEHEWVHDSERFQHLNDFPKPEREAKLKHYTKFLFVRDPFVRLISAYRDKLGSAAEHWRQLQPPGAMWGFSVLSMDTLTHRRSRRELNLRLSDWMSNALPLHPSMLSKPFAQSCRVCSSF